MPWYRAMERVPVCNGARRVGVAERTKRTCLQCRQNVYVAGARQVGQGTACVGTAKAGASRC